MADSFIPDDEQDSFIPDSFVPDQLPFTPQQQVEADIASRRTPSLSTSIPEALSSVARNPVQTLSAILRGDLPMQAVMRVAQAVGSRAEAALANPALALQRGDPSHALPELVQGLTGDRQGQLGDVMVGAGVPRSTGIPQTIGFLASLGLMPGGVKAAAETGGVAGDIGRTMAKAEPVQQFQLGRPSTIAKPNPVRALRLEHIQQRLLNAPKIAGKAFETGLQDVVKQHPTTVIDATEPLLNINTMRQQNEHFNSLLELSLRQAPISETQRGIVRNLLASPEAAQNLSLEQAQALKQVLQQGLKQKFAQQIPSYFGAHLDMLDALHTLRLKEVEAFPQFEKVMEGYANTLQNFRAIKGSLKDSGIQGAILGDFKNNDLAIKALRELATEDTLNMITGLQKATSFRKFLIRTGKIGGATAAGALTPPGRRLLQVAFPHQE